MLRVLVVTTYFGTHSYVEVKCSFRLRFPEREAPDNKTIWRNVKKYSHHGTSLNINKPWLYKFRLRGEVKRVLCKFLTNLDLFNSSFWRLQSSTPKPPYLQNIFNVGESSIKLEIREVYLTNSKNDKIPLSSSKGFFTRRAFFIHTVYRKDPLSQTKATNLVLFRNCRFSLLIFYDERKRRPTLAALGLCLLP